MTSPSSNFHINRRLVRIRKGINSVKGKGATVLLTLLKSNGLIAEAAECSRKLKVDCPVTWSIMRNKLQGIDMIFFLIQPMIQEYVDRLNLLEKQPAVFAKVMGALIRDRQANNILRPYIV